MKKKKQLSKGEALVYNWNRMLTVKSLLESIMTNN